MSEKKNKKHWNIYNTTSLTDSDHATRSWKRFIVETIRLQISGLWSGLIEKKKRIFKRKGQKGFIPRADEPRWCASPKSINLVAFYFTITLSRRYLVILRPLIFRLATFQTSPPLSTGPEGSTDPSSRYMDKGLFTFGNVALFLHGLHYWRIAIN